MVRNCTNIILELQLQILSAGRVLNKLAWTFIKYIFAEFGNLDRHIIQRNKHSICMP